VGFWVLLFFRDPGRMNKDTAKITMMEVLKRAEKERKFL
jgi:hypothetical protein